MPVLITPNHATHADAYSIYAAADEIGMPLYLMAAWQVFADKSWFGQQVLRWHGCFSIDREATDLRAFKQAVEVLERREHPLVIFPEGEVYHCNARVRPFREGAAAIALSATKRAKRPVVCVPCGIWYTYVDNPHDELVKLMDELEREMFWRPRPDLPLAQRIYRFAEVSLTIKELEFLGKPGGGPLPERIGVLTDKIIRDIEVRYDIPPEPGRSPGASQGAALTRHSGSGSMRIWTALPGPGCTKNWTICSWPYSCTAIPVTTWRKSRRSNGWPRHWTNSKRMCSTVSRPRCAAADARKWRSVNRLKFSGRAAGARLPLP